MVNTEAVNDMLEAYRKLGGKVAIIENILLKFPKMDNSILKERLEMFKEEKAEISEMLVAEFEQIDISKLAKAINHS
ncbi:MAG: hypothetical protein H7325_09715 [Pedobacter sp.]|nr:hypothetical protein [Pedobacter sp.]